jgi:hypothetical protein
VVTYCLLQFYISPVSVHEFKLEVRSHGIQVDIGIVVDRTFKFQLRWNVSWCNAFVRDCMSVDDRCLKAAFFEDVQFQLHAVQRESNMPFTEHGTF